jgi:hypothetical protein
VTKAGALIARVPFAVAIADKGSDSRRLVRAIRARGAEAVIPSRENGTHLRVIDRRWYKDRNLAERFWAKVTVERRVSTRY